MRHVLALRARSRRVRDPSGGSLGPGALPGVAALSAGVSRGRISQFGETRQWFGEEAAWQVLGNGGGRTGGVGALEAGGGAKELPHWSGLGIFPPRSVKDDSKEPGMSSERHSE